MANPTKTDILKKAMIQALEKSLGIVTTACKNVGIHRSTYYDWYNNDLTFKKNYRSMSLVSSLDIDKS